MTLREWVRHQWWKLFHKHYPRHMYSYGYTEYGLGQYEFDMCDCGWFNGQIRNFKPDLEGLDGEEKEHALQAVRTEEVRKP